MAAVRALAFPAPAGMNRLLSSAAISSDGVPRTRGDEPRWLTIVKLILVRSPHPRG